MIISFLISTTVILLISLNNNFFGSKLSLLDKPTKDKIHKKKTPLLGGLIISIILIIFLIFNHKNEDDYLFPFIFLAFDGGGIERLNPNQIILLNKSEK